MNRKTFQQKQQTANPDTSFLTRFGKTCLLVPTAVFTITTMFLINILQLLCSPLALIFRGLLYRINSGFAGFTWKICQRMFEDENGVRIKITGLDMLVDGDSALVISNHCSFVDFALIHAVAERKKMIGNCRYFAKDSIKYLPFFGWAMYLAGFVFLKRAWDKDQKAINSTFDLFTKYSLPIYLISFLEGSRVNADKIAKSKDYAAKNGLPLLNHVLLPRTKGFIATLKGLRNSHIHYVYDLTLGFAHYQRGFGATPSLFDYLFGRLNEYQFRVHCERFAISELPVEDAEISKWLYELFEKKDAKLAQMKAEFEATSSLPAKKLI